MPDLSLISIPAFYVLALAPHTWAFATVNKYTQWDNVNARGEAHLQHLKQKLPAPVFAKFERAEAAHKNSVENFPLFAAAIGAGLLAEKVAKQDVGNAQFAGTWLAIRTLYTLLYINTESQQWSVARSATFFGGLGLCFWQIYKAAVALA